MVDGKVTSRDTTMTFTCFIFFDMFNALSCRSMVHYSFFSELTCKLLLTIVALQLLCDASTPYGVQPHSSDAAERERHV